ncbi:hypothetical protein L596_030499 [Steinernema carpocapsae]|uniref:Uncharacterized protein n=1 Tax=Steinernema carpocapsae TaxID=34508 RepID=A0A4U5LPM3_STECR|nr:hypothetical protein L596_030499 [Steinernema carpocapsae]
MTPRATSQLPVLGNEPRRCTSTQGVVGLSDGDATIAVWDGMHDGAMARHRSMFVIWCSWKCEIFNCSLDPMFFMVIIIGSDCFWDCFGYLWVNLVIYG